MVPDRDHYADKNGKLTQDPNEYARQVAVKGCFLDPRIASRYGIENGLVSVDEPSAPRRITPAGEASVKITKSEETKEASKPPAAAGGEVKDKPQEPADAAEPKKPAAKKEKKQS